MMRKTIGGTYGDATATGGAEHEIITGTAGADRMAGYHGSDVLRGGAGNDTLWGGKGGDVLNGGAGADDLLFYGGDMGRGAERDQVVGFQDGIDQILLDAATISPKATTVSDLYAADGTFLGARIETEGLGPTPGPRGGAFIDVLGIHASDLQIGTDIVWI